MIKKQKTYKLIVSYDGTAYAGWQAQPGKPSIEHTLNNTFKHVFKTDMKVLGASRTDAGVHALGQVVRVKTALSLTPQKLCWAWNNSLPEDIVIRSLGEVPDTFNPFHNVRQKTYYYHFFLERPSPFLQRYGYYYPYPTNIVLLEQALRCFVGTHDFASFRNSEDTRTDTTRTIDGITLEHIKRYNVYRITVKGQKFLRHMIRRIVGASLAVASRQHGSIEQIGDVMKQCNPHHTLPNAPAKGLLLYKIIYYP